MTPSAKAARLQVAAEKIEATIRAAVETGHLGEEHLAMLEAPTRFTDLRILFKLEAAAASLEALVPQLKKRPHKKTDPGGE